MSTSYSKTVSFVRSIYGSNFVPLHRPLFAGNEKRYLEECIDSNFVSSVGEKVSEFESQVAKFTNARFAIATVTGTSALQVSLVLAGVEKSDEVITQALTFVATCNAISYCNATPVFVDVDRDTMGMSPASLERFLGEFCEVRSGVTYNKKTGNKIKACVPMHTFGLPCRINEILKICKVWNIPLIEDAAESLGSFCGDQHTGTFGFSSALSFNGNKIITTGGGGMILTDDENVAKRAKHITTTAKVPHAYEYSHDEIGFNFRLTNLSAALGCAQMELLPRMLEIKERVANQYYEFFNSINWQFVLPLKNCRSNNWLNAIILGNKNERNEFLEYTNKNDVMTRPIWRLMSDLEMYRNCQNDGLVNSKWLVDRVVNVPSSVPEAFENFSNE